MPESYESYYGDYNAITGCVATATAQIMKYYNWPATGTGQHSYSCDIGYGDGLSYSATLSADFSSSTYDWGLMMDDYYSDEDNVYCANGDEDFVLATQAQQDAVAKLMSDVGIAMEMDYSADASSASCWYAAKALETYFHYSNTWKYIYRDDYDGDWDATMRKELDAHRPILYAGSSSQSGHAFIFDGYRTDGYFHVNWGWGGWCDGYFLSTLLNPDEEGDYVYNDYQYAYIGIEPDRNADGAVTPGDVNEDHVVDIDDLNWVINHMVKKTTLTGHRFDNADCHQDGVIDIDDLNFIINLMIRKGYSHATPMSLVVDLRNGGRVVFPLADNPQLTFEGDNLHVKSKYDDYYFGRNELLRLSYVATTTANKLQPTHRNVSSDNPNQNAIYIYRNDNDFNAHLNPDVQRIQFSSVGTDGKWYDNALVQEVWTPDSVFRIPVAAVDSVTFQAPAPVVKQGLFVITEEHLPYMTTATDSTLTFKSSTPTGMHPAKGQVVYSELENDWFTMGFAGRVTTVTTRGSEVFYECEPISPHDVYDRLVTVGKIEATGNGSQGAPRRIADDGIIRSPKISIDVGYEDYIRLKGSAAMTIDYAFNFGFGGKDFANVTLTDELELTLSTSFKKSLGKISEEKMLPIPVAYIGNTVVGASVNVGLFFELKGSAELTLNVPFKFKHIEEYKWSSDDFFHISYDKRSEGSWGNFGDAVDNAECVLKVKGGAKFGPIVKASLMIWKPKFLSINAALKGGPQVDGSFEFDFNDPEGYNAYDLLAKDTKLSTGIYLGVDVTAQTWKKVYDVATIGTTLFKRDSYLFPRFTQPNFASLTSSNPVAWEAGLDPMSVYTVPSNNLWLPGKVGIGLYDNEGNEVGKRYYGNWYFGGTEREWSKNWLQYNLAEDVTPGETYTVRPLFKLLNLVEVKGAPKSQLTVPQRVKFDSDTIQLPKGTEYGTLIKGGWGYFAVDNAKPSVVEAQIYDSGDNHYLRLKGLKKGNADLTVTDLRNNQTANVVIKVLDPQLLLSAENVRVNVDEEARVDVLGGSGNFSAVCADPQKATVRVCTESGTPERQGGWSYTNHYVSVTGVSPGETTVTITDTESGKTATFNVTVNDPDTGLSLSSYTLKTIEGQARRIRINEGSGDYTVKSDDTSIATASITKLWGNDYVYVTGLSQGATQVKVRDNQTGLMATIEVEVRSAYNDTMYGSPSPEDGATDVNPKRVFFTCDAPFEYGAVYQVQVSDKPDMSHIVKEYNISNHVYTTIGDFQQNTTYYWRVLKYDWELEDFLLASPIWTFTTSENAE